MGGSAETPTLPDAQPVSGVRASDAERDEVVAKLTEEFAAGRLSQDTFLFRMSAVLEARHQAELPPLLADLPSQIVPPSPAATGLVTSGPPTPPPVPPAPAAPSGAQARFTPGAQDQGHGTPGHDKQGDNQRGDNRSAVSPQARLAGRLRSVFPRRSRGEDTRYSNDPPAAPPTGGVARRLTGAMPRAAAEPPAVLRFPRGTATRFSIGRDASCDLSISDMTVSRVHAQLERSDDGWLLTDLDSTNGTRVNGWRVRGQVQVHPGDLVSFGNAEYSLGAPEGA